MHKALAASVLFFVPTMALAASGLDIDSIAGVYKYRFPNGLVDGSKFTSENVLEVAKVSPTRAYVRTHLEFYNGHICSFARVMSAEDNALVWHGKTVLNGDCELKLRFTGGKATFNDKDDHCRADSCGARGGYNGISFATSSRRTIRYMPRLLASQQYRDAMKAAGP